MSPRRRGRGHGGRGPANPAATSPDGVESSLGAPEPTAQPDEIAAAVVPLRRPANGPAPRRSGDRGPRRDQVAPRAFQPRIAPEQPAATAAPTEPSEVDASAAAVAAPGVDAVEPVGAKSSCTLAQMRRFIKSRPYIPVHELRRRFLIEGLEDEVSPMATGKGTLFVGLPEREAGFLGELVRAGEVGCEMLLDPTSPGVVGVFPMRPVARQ